MKLHIKNMVCLRCIMIVEEELKKLGIQVETVELGGARIKETLTRAQLDQLNKNLKKSNLELIEDNKTILTEKVKNLIIEMIHYSEELPKVNYSTWLSEKLHLNYTYISNTFSTVTGTTIENFIILHKIERVKELLTYNELNLTEISYKMQYSSVAHLSNQFKKVTGLPPSRFKKMKDNQRLALEEI